jgi:aldose 1-epimerase
MRQHLSFILPVRERRLRPVPPPPASASPRNRGEECWCRLRRLAFLLLAFIIPATAEAASVSTARYGTTRDGRAVRQVTLRGDRGLMVKLISYGAAVTDIVFPDRRGRLANVVLGYGKFADYENYMRRNYFGATVGRYAGRIAGARFAIDGQEYRLQPNDGQNALHGGAPPGLESRLWRVRTFRAGQAVGAVFDYASPEGEQGFPGALALRVTYKLEPGNALRIDYEARTTRPTVLNLTNHAYFNLAGAGSGSVARQKLRIFADRWVADKGGIPTGEFPSVAGTPLDFRAPTAIGLRADSRIAPMSERGGYNHAWLLNKKEPGELGAAAVLSDPDSGRVLTVSTTEPSLQVYTGDYFSGEDVGAQGKIYRARDGIALETQHLSDSPNRPDFQSTLLRPGEVFRSSTVWRFSTLRR